MTKLSTPTDKFLSPHHRSKLCIDILLLAQSGTQFGMKTLRIFHTYILTPIVIKTEI